MLKVKNFVFTLFLTFILIFSGFGQNKEVAGNKILFRGLVLDSKTFSPIANLQIIINRSLASVSGRDGTFVFYVNRKDTIVFKSLGYKPTILEVSDTLKGNEFVTGVYMNTDTLAIGEVVIIPKLTNLKSQILNGPSRTPSTFENAKYNVAISAYQGRNSQGSLGTPADNYSLLSKQQKVNAYERGGIPSDRILGLSPLLLIPAGYMLIKGLPEEPAPFKPELTDQEVNQIQKKYFEMLKQRK